MEKLLFSEMNISPEVKKAIEVLGFETPTDIQQQAIPHVLEGRDVVGEAQTGTGKTLSFAIPIIERINVKNPAIQALVMLPTRELALQVYAEFIKLVKFSKKIRVVTIYGGQSIERQIKDLKEKPQIVIGTPGRIIDHMNRKTLNFSNLQVLVLDEADEMLKMGFQEDIEYILQTTPKERQTTLFSATMPATIREVARKYLNDPVNIKIATKTLTVDRIRQVYYEIKSQSKLDLLIRLLDYYAFNSVIIFCNTKAMVDELASSLQKHEYSVDGIHGDLKQLQRDRVMNAFRSGAIKILIATDVAARGIDVKGVEAVFNYDLPLDDESYVHRIGRTGRAGLNGTSISFVTARTRSRLQDIIKYTKSDMERLEVPQISEIEKMKNRLIYNKIIDAMNQENKRNHKSIINRLMSEGYDGIDVLNALLDIMFKDEVKEYNEILIEEPKKPSSRFSKDNKSYSYYQINLGKIHGLGPKTFLDLVNKHTKINSKAIGDIKIRNQKISFEVRADVSKKILLMDGKKYQGMTIRVKKVNSLD